MGAKGWFCGPSYLASSPNVLAEVCKNFIPELNPPRAKGRVALIGRPGLGGGVTIGPGPHRGACEHDGVEYYLSGVGFYTRDPDGTVTNRGTVAYINGEPGTVHANATQIFIVSGGLGYVYTIATTGFAQVVDADFPTDALMGFYFNGHFGAVERNSRRFSISAANDGSTWSGLDIATKTRTIDKIVSVVVDNDAVEMHLIGSRTSEVWWYSGAAAFPMEPVPNMIVPSGGGAGRSFITIGGSVYGLAQSQEGGHVPVRFQAGYTPEPIGTHAIATAIQRYPLADIMAATAFTLEWHAHRFYVLTFPNQGTWVYDEATGWWSEWTLWNATTGRDEPFLGATHLFANGTHYIGSRRDGTVYTFSEDYHDDDGTVIRMVKRGTYLADGPHRLLHRRLWFDVQTGVGLTSGQGSDPIGMVRYSDDGANTWSDELRIRLGKLGEYRAMAELRRLGLAGPAGRVYELVITDPVVRAISDADVEVLQEAAA